jgi:IMP dehydrogenase
MRESLTYNDIGLVPVEPSVILTRNECNTSTFFLDRTLKLPVVSAPMQTVTGADMANKLFDLGSCGVLHRTNDLEKDIKEFILSNRMGIPSIGATGDYLERAARFIQEGARVLCIDTANGFHVAVANAITKLRKSKIPIKIIAGNVGSVEGYEFLAKYGADVVRVGIGNGAACSTSIATGVGMGQVTLLQDIQRHRELFTSSPLVIADGGIKEPGDVCKALALGADVVMVGSYFAGTEESPGEKVVWGVNDHGDATYAKRYAGEASRSVKGEGAKYVEGVETWIPFKGSVEGQVQALDDGLKSSMAYMNCLTLSEFRKLPEKCFVRLSQGARLERTPHILNR